MENHYRIRSNREFGDGRFAISLIPRENKYPGIIMELKWKGGLDEEALEALAELALVQINDKRYDSEMRYSGIKKVQACCQT